jgi:hypothetical protein
LGCGERGGRTSWVSHCVFAVTLLSRTRFGSGEHATACLSPVGGVPGTAQRGCSHHQERLNERSRRPQPSARSAERWLGKGAPQRSQRRAIIVPTLAVLQAITCGRRSASAHQRPRQRTAETPRNARHWVPHGLRRRLAEHKPRHRAQGAQNTGKQHNPNGPPCSATRRLRCEEEGLLGRGRPDLDLYLASYGITRQSGFRGHC